MELVKLAEAKVGSWLRVLNISSGADYYRHRLLSEGLIPGSLFKVQWVAPLGDPVIVQLKGQHTFSLRKREASILEIEYV